MESWLSTLKYELDERFDDIEVLYNQTQRLSAIYYASPAEYDKTRLTGPLAESPTCLPNRILQCANRIGTAALRNEMMPLP
jgi:hypothetical protein